MLVVHHERPAARTLAVELADTLANRGHRVWMPDADSFGLPQFVAAIPAVEADLVVSLGGDGTMLRAVSLLDGAPVPLLGVNLGRLGYLTEIEPHEVHDALSRFELGAADGEWQIDERMMLDVVVRDPDGATIATWRALNEAVVEKRDPGHTVQLLVRIDGEAFTSYTADGMIVSTPTGSTAYSLSARGPIISPKHRAVLVTPVAPHMLFDRSLVLDPSETVEIQVLGDRPTAVAIDGRFAGDLTQGASVRCTPSIATARFVRFGGHTYHQVLKSKFGLSDR